MTNPPKDLTELTEIRARTIASAEGLHEEVIDSIFSANKHWGTSISFDGTKCNMPVVCDLCHANYFRTIARAIAEADEAVGVVSVPYQRLSSYLYDANGRQAFYITVETPYRPKPKEAKDD